MLFAGFNVHEGEYPLWAAVVVGSVANLVGSWIAYAIGYYGRLELLEKHGKFLHITPSHLAWADRWFERYGAPAVFFSRMLPIVRTFISLPAGVARMPFWKFSVLTFAGCLPWVFALTFAGQKAAENWTSWKDSLHYVDYTVAVLIVLGAVVPRRPLEAQPQPRARRGCAGLAARSSCATRWRSGCSTGPPSCCRSPPRRTPRSCRGCSAGPTPSSTPSCARPSRWRCTPARRRRCSSGCATRWRPPRAGSTAAARVLIAGLVRAAGRSSATRSSARSSGAWARRRRSPSGLLLGVGGHGGRRPLRADGPRAARRPASPTRSRSASPRPAR